jgi:hypothetical protein
MESSTISYANKHSYSTGRPLHCCFLSFRAMPVAASTASEANARDTRIFMRSV